MGWVSPTGFVDSGGVWTDETLAYDENTGTYVYASALKSAWTDYLELTHAALDCDKIHVWVDHAIANINSIEIDVYYDSAWNNIFSGAPSSWGAWVEYAIGSTQSVTAMRVRFYSTKASTDGCQIMEADFNEIAGPSPGWNKILYTSEPPTPNAWNQVKQEAGTGWKKLLYI